VSWDKQRELQSMKILYRILLTGLLALPLISAAESRWYDQSIADKGNVLFQQNCASCHGVNGESTTEWKTADSNGKYPPPPLNGTAHTWHHPKQQLEQTIREGGIKLGGLMPAFEEKLSDQEIDAVIAFFQSKWPEDTYQKWADRFQTSAAAGEATSQQAENTLPAENKFTNLLQLRLGNKPVSDPVKTPVDGIYQVQFGSQFGYLSENGRYVFVGEMIDLQTGENLTALVKGQAAIAELNQVALEDKVIFSAKGEEKAVLNIFTDTTCPYCKKLHAEVDKLQQAGISVHYLPYPRGGEKGPGYQELKQVWCASNKPEAMSIAKGLEVGDLPAGDCEAGKFVDAGHALGIKVGINGTPSLFLSNGENINGYVPYPELIPMVLKN